MLRLNRIGIEHRAGSSETFREGEPPCEPSADAGSHGASPSPRRRRGLRRRQDRKGRTL